MKRFLYCLFFLPIVLAAQNLDSISMQQLLVVGNMQAFHISPPDFNVTTNKQIVDLFIDEVDGRKMFFLKAEKERLRSLVTDNSSNDGYSVLIKETFDLMKMRLLQIDSMLADIETKPLVFSEKDTITFLSKKATYRSCENLRELRVRMEKRLKYDCLNQVIKPGKENEDVLKLSPAELKTKQADATKKAIIRVRRYLQNFDTEFKLKHHIGDGLSNAITLRCDPHSSYFNTYEKENWDSGLSMEEFSFGFYAGDNDDGDIIISELIPGGPAWKSNELHEGDAILAFQFEKENKVELINAELEDFYLLFYKSAEKNVELTVRKKDNQVRKIKLEKEKIQSQENVMSSYVINNDKTKFGYIPIPAFYSDDETDSRQGCANDVAKEIIKLKNDSIQGLILDLRYNGGGSMKEAMGLAGIFIDEGPVAVFKQRVGKPMLLKDFNRGTIYDGPLIVLINGASASASEFLTATLQDYKRAVIVGSTTFGKGTAQNVYPADTNLYKTKGKSFYINPTMGYVKITGGKFYRVTTQSHQGKGIEPDIHIPDMVESFLDKESEMEYFLPADSVNKKVIYNALNALPLTELKGKSESRIKANEQFKNMLFLADSIATAAEKDVKVVLTVKDFKKYSDEQDKLGQKIENAIELKDSDELSVKNNSVMLKLVSIDEYQRKNSERILVGIKKDLILKEAVNILGDLQYYQTK
ncbi:MAG TPA: carboxy terminal-processing peptidase [Bacteroidia bacterium]